MIVHAENSNIDAAAKIYTLSWKDSHKNVCSEEFIEKHSEEYMKAYLSEKQRNGCEIYICYEKETPVGIVGKSPDDEICLLYILPEYQGKGWGSLLLNYAVKLCKNPWVTVLETNKRAAEFYKKHGFAFVGEKDTLSKKRFSEHKYVYRGENM